jgi:hypothetical protein
MSIKPPPISLAARSHPPTFFLYHMVRPPVRDAPLWRIHSRQEGANPTPGSRRKK